MDADTIAYQHSAPDGTYVALYNIRTGALRRAVTDPASPFYNKGANEVRAGGGVWCCWLSGFGLFASTGLYLPNAGLLAVGDGGEIIYIEDYQSGAPVRVREKPLSRDVHYGRDRGGDDWLLSAGAVLDADAYGEGRVIYTDYAQVVHVVGLPEPTIIGGVCFRARAAFVNGEWWVCYFSGLVGVVTHPFTSTMGYPIKRVGDCWADISALDGHPALLGVGYAVTQGEAPGSVTYRPIDVVTTTRVELTPGPTPPEPPDPGPEDDVKVPIVTIDAWTLDDVLDGREVRWHDAGNPELQLSGRCWVEGTNFRVSLTNKTGSAATGAQRTVHPCSQGQPGPEPPEPPATRVSIAFGPNLGSVDFQQCFTELDKWTYGRDRIHAFRFAQGNIIDRGNPAWVGPNTYEAFLEVDAFKKLVTWGIKCELGVDSDAGPVIECLDRIVWGGGPSDVIIGWDHLFVEDTAWIPPDEFVAAAEEVLRRYPASVIGVYAAFPITSADGIRARLEEFIDLGFCPAFCRLDVDPNQREALTQRAFDSLRQTCDELGIALKVVINAGDDNDDALRPRGEGVAHAGARARPGWPGLSRAGRARRGPAEVHNPPDTDTSSHTSPSTTAPVLTKPGRKPPAAASHPALKFCWKTASAALPEGRAGVPHRQPCPGCLRGSETAERHARAGGRRGLLCERGGRGRQSRSGDCRQRLGRVGPRGRRTRRWRGLPLPAQRPSALVARRRHGARRHGQRRRVGDVHQASVHECPGVWPPDH